MQQSEAPAFDQKLVGKWLELCWSYTNKETGEKMLVWITGRVARVADGLTDKRSARAKKLLPAGALFCGNGRPTRRSTSRRGSSG